MEFVISQHPKCAQCAKYYAFQKNKYQIFFLPTTSLIEIFIPKTISVKVVEKRVRVYSFLCCADSCNNFTIYLQKINPDSFGVYLGYVIGIVLIRVFVRCFIGGAYYFVTNQTKLKERIRI